MEGVFLDQERVGSTSPMVNKVLKEHAIENIAGTICLYIDDTTGWVLVGSSLGYQTIVTAIGKYVPVNYQVAAEPIIAEMLAYSWEWITFSTTFTLGACRYNVTCERDEGRPWLVFSMAIVDGDGPDHPSFRARCCIPIPCYFIVTHMPLNVRATNLPSHMGLVKWIAEVFGR